MYYVGRRPRPVKPACAQANSARRGWLAGLNGDSAEAGELLLAGAGGAAGAYPAVGAAVLLVGAEVGEDGEEISVAAC